MIPAPSDTSDGTMGRRLERVRDELAIVEAKLAEAWPDPRRVRAELDAGERELIALRAEALDLEGPRRFLQFAVIVALAAAASFTVLLAYFLAGGR